MTLSIGDGPVVVEFPFAQVGNFTLAVVNLFDRVCNASDRLCADHEVNSLDLVKQGFALKLRNATHDADDWLNIAIIAELADPRVKFVLSLLSNRACIDKDYIRGILVWRDLKTFRRE